ncbi:MAG: Type 1 glutamine amidotransferase-like domain-containing protein [Patescibacteria group bacterium]
MTTYILHGGETKIPNENQRDFFRSLMGKDKKPKILCAYFASEKSSWKNKLKQDLGRLQNFADKKAEPEAQIASENIEELIEQIKWATCVYIRGGSDSTPRLVFEKIPDLKNLLNNKIIAGSSAGAHVIVKYYHSKSLNHVRDGLGLLPIKIYTHADIKVDTNLNELIKHKEHLPVVVLMDTEFVIIIY